MKHEELLSTIQRLADVEQYAFETYHDISEEESISKDFKSFMSSLADDEAFHLHVMRSAELYVKNNKDNNYTTEFIFDDATYKRITEPLLAIRNLDPKNINYFEEILQKTVQSETSEWNDMFLYVINLLKHDNKVFEYTAAKIETHKESILTFLEHYKKSHSISNELTLTLPRIWDRKILIVEDEPALRTFLKAILSHFGTVVAAEDGFEGLEQLENSFFDLTISDINMPHIDGLKMFREVLKKDNSISERFIFHTAEEDNESLSDLETLKVPVIFKPANVSDIFDIVKEKLNIPL